MRPLAYPPGSAPQFGPDEESDEVPLMRGHRIADVMQSFGSIMLRGSPTRSS